MTDTTNLDLMRRLDPLDMGTADELDPAGATARRVHAAAIATAQQPGLTTHGHAACASPRPADRPGRQRHRRAGRCRVSHRFAGRR
jgi:hypothetical protein